MTSGIATAIGILILLLIGGFIGFMVFSLSAGAKLTSENAKLRRQVTRYQASNQSQLAQIADLSASITGQQNRQILESMGWRPLAPESLPGDGDQVLVSGAATRTPLRQAPNGAHYARFTLLPTGEGRLTRGASPGENVPLDGMILWAPPRILVR